MSLTYSELRSRLSSVEFVPLLCAVSELLDDDFEAPPGIRPRVPKVLISPKPELGLTEAAISDELERLTTRLLPILAKGPIKDKCAAHVDTLLRFLSADEDHIDLLREQLYGSLDVQWTKNELNEKRDLTVTVIGAGPSGLAMAHALKKIGINFTVYDENAEIGGTWWVNDYPGCRLDTGRLSYSYSFFQKSDWSSYFTPQAELLKYYQDFANKKELRAHIKLSRHVKSTAFNIKKNKWEITIENLKTNIQEIIESDILITALGVLTIPKNPPIDGIDQFAGDIVHSSRWNHDLDLNGKVVSLIGTGASAYQIGPAIATQVSKLNVFQRNAPWVIPAPHYHDRLDDQHAWICKYIPSYPRWERIWEFWLFNIGKYALSEVDPTWSKAGALSYLNEKFRAYTADHIIGQYQDRPELIDKVLPKYPITAKRMVRDNGVWSHMLKSDNVALVVDKIKRIDGNAIITEDNERYPTDIIIFATGFQTNYPLAGLDIRDNSGQKFKDVWGQTPITYNTIMFPGCPNLFALDGPNTGLVTTGNQIYMTECAINWILEAIHALLARNATRIEPTAKAAERFTQWIDDGSSKRVWGAANVASWYKNDNGKVTVSWPYSLLDYWRRTRCVDENDMIFGYE